ncbi:unnamed protein product [Effrenium voratum]|nr:unnamed protein product [Effrenium voratum]
MSCHGEWSEGLGAGAPPGLDKTWQTRVHVRNTFIEVDEEELAHAERALSGLDLHNAPGRTWRRGHLRCASEPMSFNMSLSVSPFPAMQSGTLQSDSGRNVPAERGRAITAPKSRSQPHVSPTIQESLEEYDDHVRNSMSHPAQLPRYVDVRPVERWRGEPMLVDVGASSSGFTADEGFPSPDWRSATLSMPVQRFRHARQRSRTIQEDQELDAQLADVAAAPAWDVQNVNVRVRNTFIEVDESGSDHCDPTTRAAWKPGHLRCASEPIPSFPTPRERISGFHSRTSSYQEDSLEMDLLAQPLCHDSETQKSGTEIPLMPSQHNMFVDSKLAEHRVAQTLVILPNQQFADPLSSTSKGSSFMTPIKTSPCKWHSRGTCKYGDACRFSHAKKRQSSSEKKPGPLPAGPVPGPHPIPAGAVGTQAQPQPAGLLPGQRPASSSHPRCRSASPVSTTAGSSGEAEPGETAQSSQRPSNLDKSHQVFWCDSRAFKHEFQGLRDELESGIGMTAKSHKTAEKCIRLLKKKQRVRAERGRSLQKARPLVFLVSWANAQELVKFLQEAVHMPPLKVVVLCDTNGPRTRAAAERWAKDVMVIECVAATWPEAVKAVQTLLSSSSLL